jgi:UDP:flavonoid glycosyltransferase YjiC (YdhE family)
MQVDTCPLAWDSLPQRLSAAVEELLGDAEVAQRAAELGQRLRATNGAEVAAKLVKDFLLEK